MSKIIKSLIVLSSIVFALNSIASEEVNEAVNLNSSAQEHSSVEATDSSDSNKVDEAKPEKSKKKKNKKKHKYKNKNKTKSKVDANKSIEDTSSTSQEMENKTETK